MRNLRTLLALVALSCAPPPAWAQIGNSCGAATPLTTQSPVNSSLSNGEGWFSFVANSKNIRLNVDATLFDDNVGHIHKMVLYQGNCQNLNQVSSRTIGMAKAQGPMQMDLEVGALNLGSTYYLQLKQHPGNQTCPKANCQALTSIPVSVKLSDMDVFIPTDPAAPVSWHAFEENRGQLQMEGGGPAKDVAFYTTGSNPACYASSSQFSLVWIKDDTSSTKPDSLHRVDVRFKTRGALPPLLKTEANEAYSNYYLGHTPDGVLENKNYGRLIQKEIAPGVDLHYYSDHAGLKWYLVCEPGADPAEVKFTIDGASQVQALTTGGLAIHTSLGNMTWKKAQVYRINPAGNHVPMPSSGTFVQDNSGQWSIDCLPAHGNMRQIIVVGQDVLPPVLSPTALLPAWGTFYKGPANSDNCLNMDTDGSGNMYAVGETYSFNFPLLVGQSVTLAGPSDAYLTKFNPDYVRLFSTLIGSTSWDRALGVATEPVSGRVYMCGSTLVGSSGWPMVSGPPGSFLQNYPQGNTGTSFLAGFNSTTGFRQWATLFGGWGSMATSLAADASGNLYMVGATYETNVVKTTQPTSGYAYPVAGHIGFFVQNQNNSSPSSPNGDGYLARFNTQGQLTWSTLIGGNREDAILDVAVDEFYQKLYLVGGWKSDPLGGNTFTSPCTYMPLIPNGGYFQQNTDGNGVTKTGDGLILKFSMLTGVLEWSSLFGGSGYDLITSIATTQQIPALTANPHGNIYISGRTNTPIYEGNCSPPQTGGFPRCSTNTNQFHQSAYGGQNDAFVAKFTGNTQLAWSTYLGGAGDDVSTYSSTSPGPKIKSIPSGLTYVTTSTKSGSGGLATLPIVGNSVLYGQPLHGDVSGSSASSDGYIAGFGSNDNLFYGTYWGGAGDDYNHALAFANNKIYVAGITASTANFPLYNPIPLPGTAWFQTYPIQGGTDVHYGQLQTAPIPAIAQQMRLGGRVKIFPNPSSHQLQFQIEDAKIGSLLIFDMIGTRLDAPFSLSGDSFATIEVSHLLPGTYLLKCIDTKGIVSTTKFVKQ